MFEENNCISCLARRKAKLWRWEEVSVFFFLLLLLFFQMLFKLDLGNLHDNKFLSSFARSCWIWSLLTHFQGPMRNNRSYHSCFPIFSANKLSICSSWQHLWYLNVSHVMNIRCMPVRCVWALVFSCVVNTCNHDEFQTCDKCLFGY